MRCACVALLRGRRLVCAGARRAGLPVRGIGYCETVDGYPTPPFFRRRVCERRILSTCVVVVLVSCCVPVACGAVRISVMRVYPCRRALYAGRVLYGYCAMLYPLAGAICPPCARICTTAPIVPAMAILSAMRRISRLYAYIHSTSARVGSCPA